MTVITLNNTEFEVESYSKNTYFTGESIMSNANCTVRVTNVSALNDLIEEPITSIQIEYENEVIYTLDNINARIDNVNEYLSGDHISTIINMTFLNT